MIRIERIKELANKYNKNLVQVNDEAGLGTRSIYSWKKVNPPKDKIDKVAKVLHTTSDYLTGLTDNPAIPNPDNNEVDLDDDETIFTYQGKPIPPEDMKIIRRLLNSDND